MFSGASKGQTTNQKRLRTIGQGHRLPSPSLEVPLPMGFPWMWKHFIASKSLEVPLLPAESEGSSANSWAMQDGNETPSLHKSEALEHCFV